MPQENIIKDIRNPFRLNQEINYTPIKDITILFRIEKKIKQLKVEYFEILKMFLSMKKKIIINQ